MCSVSRANLLINKHFYNIPVQFHKYSIHGNAISHGTLKHGML